MMQSALSLPSFVPALSRRTFLSMSLRSLASCAIGYLAAPFRSAFAGASPSLKYFRRIVAKDNRSAATIEWQCDALLGDPRFFWRENEKSKENEADIDVRYLEIERHPVFVYCTALKGLSAGKEYRCRVTAAGKPAASFSFRTDDGGACKALIFPDSQCDGSYDTWERVSSEAVRRCPDAALWVNMGDLTDNGASFFHWDGWQSATDVSLGGRAFAPVMGNHDCYSLDWNNAVPAAFLGLFATPSNGSARYDRYYYSFDYGPVHFIVLNTQRAELDRLAPGLFEEQAAWLADDLKKAKKPWRVALLHRDLIDYDEEPPTPDPFVRNLLPLIEASGVDAALTAHAHAYRRRRMTAWKSDKTGVLYILTGNAGNCFYDVERHAIDEIALPSNLLNYLVMEADETRLTFRCFLPNGIQKDFVTLRKSPNLEE
ncbi:MAG: metallophosphoesterase [Schwartzia sp.]|nr:metallophosphoesterase [Schwartzia sp. (in: firmicutes)]